MRVDEHTISLDDSPVYYRSADRSGMPTLYLHGIPTSCDDWVEFLARTGGIAPDLIGFGRSGKGGHLDYSLAGLAQFVERFLDHLEIDDVQVVGHDWGAAVGLDLRRAQPRTRRAGSCSSTPRRLLTATGRESCACGERRGLGELVMGAITQGLFARTAAARVRPRRRVVRHTDRRGVGPVRPGHPAGDPPSRPVRER